MLRYIVPTQWPSNSRALETDLASGFSSNAMEAMIAFLCAMAMLDLHAERKAGIVM